MPVMEAVEVAGLQGLNVNGNTGLKRRREKKWWEGVSMLTSLSFQSP